ncbi:unnamed protein product, partial [marine sediment metagenome]
GLNSPFDANDDGIGDFPYQIEGNLGSVDNFPIWDDGPGGDTTPPFINVLYYDLNATNDSGSIYIEAEIYDNILLGLVISLEFYYPNGTLITSEQMISQGNEIYTYDWGVVGYPTLEDYYFIINVTDISGNSASVMNYFSIIEPDYIVLSPFVIDDDGNGNFTWAEASNQIWCTGSGTFDDPYIIEKIVIYGDWSTNGLEIRNSNKYFEIKNCTIKDSGNSYNMGCIVLTNVMNGAIINNYLLNGFSGINLVASLNITIKGNIASGNGNGIKLENSDANTISNNIVK